jgi:hypothetical protein
MDVQIGEVTTELTITESVGDLSPEEVRRLVKIVLEQVQNERARDERRERDTAVTDRAFRK